MSENYTNEYGSSFYEAINDEAYDNDRTVAYEIVLRDIQKLEEKNKIAYAKNEGLEEVVRIAEKYHGRGFEGNRECFEECFGFDIVDTFNNMSCDPYAYGSSEDLSVENARPGIRVGKLGGEQLWYDVRKNKRNFSKDGEKFKDDYEHIPASRNALKRKIIIATLFPNIERKFVKDKKFPVYPLISIILCLAIMIIPIYLSALNNEIDTQNKEYDAYIRELENEISLLNEELCKKNDMALIDRLAREEYGMIDVELSNAHLMAPSSDVIVVKDTESEEQTSIWVSLLNALGIFTDK